MEDRTTQPRRRGHLFTRADVYDKEDWGTLISAGARVVPQRCGQDTRHALGLATDVAAPPNAREYVAAVSANPAGTKKKAEERRSNLQGHRGILASFTTCGETDLCEGRANATEPPE